MPQRLALVILLFLSFQEGLLGESLGWPRFRGPDGSGIADDQRPPVEFGPQKNLRWKVPVPEGLSSPIVAGDLLVLTAFELGKLHTIAYRRTDGQQVWRREVHAEQIEKYLPGEGSPAASTPATDGERIVCYFGSCGLVCYDLTGKELWKYPLPTVELIGNFGSGVSPILVDGMTILVQDTSARSRIVAVDATSGALRWETDRTSPVSYCTPIAVQTPRGKQIVAAGHARMAAYELSTGQEQWSVSGLPTGCCASPMAVNGIVYFAGWSPGGEDDPQNQLPAYAVQLEKLDANRDGLLSLEEARKLFGSAAESLDKDRNQQLSEEEYQSVVTFFGEGSNAAFAVKVEGQGDVTNSHVLWKQTKGLPYVTTAIAYRGQLVMVKDGGIVTAYDLESGKQIYMKRAVAGGKSYASPVAANGQIYFTALEDGTVTVIQAGLDSPRVIAKNPPLGERTSATPAIADDALYIRTEKHLYAFGSS